MIPFQVTSAVAVCLPKTPDLKALKFIEKILNDLYVYLCPANNIGAATRQYPDLLGTMQPGKNGSAMLLDILGRISAHIVQMRRDPAACTDYLLEREQLDSDLEMLKLKLLVYFPSECTSLS